MSCSDLPGRNMTSHRTTIHLRSASLHMDPSNLHIIRQITRSDSSAVFEVDLNGQKYALKVFHDNGDPGYTEKVMVWTDFTVTLMLTRSFPLLVSVSAVSCQNSITTSIKRISKHYSNSSWFIVLRQRQVHAASYITRVSPKCRESELCELFRHTLSPGN